MRFKHRDIVISAFFTIFLCGSQACYGDIIIDRFNVKEDGNVIFSENDFFNINGDGTVLLAKGRADWTTGGATNRIAGGTRTVGFGPHTGAYDFSQFRLQGNGELAVSTGTAASANVKLSYNTNALEQDFVTNGQWLNLNLRGDATAGSALTLNLTFNGTEQVSVSLDKMKAGNNAFDLSTMDGFSTWGQDVDTVEFEFDAGGAVAVDYIFGALSFTENRIGTDLLTGVPEPATALAIIPLFGFFAYRRRLAKKREAAAEDEQMEVESSIK